MKLTSRQIIGYFSFLSIFLLTFQGFAEQAAPAKLPKGREFHSSIALDENTIAVAGGISDRLELYDSLKNKWSHVILPSRPSQAFYLASIKDDIYTLDAIEKNSESTISKQKNGLT